MLNLLTKCSRNLVRITTSLFLLLYIRNKKEMPYRKIKSQHVDRTDTQDHTNNADCNYANTP